MLVTAITRLFGVTDTAAKAIIVALLTALSGLLAALFPGQPWLPVAVALITALATAIDPNAGHSTT